MEWSHATNNNLIDCSFKVFIKDNQNNAETTRVNQLQIFGSPVATTNMSDFKRVAGKKGESH